MELLHRAHEALLCRKRRGRCREVEVDSAICVRTVCCSSEGAGRTLQLCGFPPRYASRSTCPGINKKLLAEKEGLTYHAKAYETALSIEAAEKDTRTFKPHPEATEGIHLTNRGGDSKWGQKQGR